MNSSNPLHWNVCDLASAIRAKKVSPVEVTRQLLEEIPRLDRGLNAFISVMAEEALADAAQAEDTLMQNAEVPPLLGVPVGLKDIFSTEKASTTMGSEFFKDFVPGLDATAVERLKRAGAIVVGKLNMHQFAYGPTGDRSYFGAVRNPHDPSKISGGSSSGSGVAVAAFMCHAALGTDTGGSIRIPASCCGVVGMKPTFGRVSRHGVFPVASTLDHVGPISRTVRDNAVLLNVISGYDPRDACSVPAQVEDFTQKLGAGIDGLSVGVPASFYLDNIQGEIAERIEQVVETFEELGATVREVETSSAGEMLSAHRVVLAAEAFAVHRERLRAEPGKFEKEVRERLLAGEEIKAYEYVEARQVKETATRSFAEALEKVQALVAPTLPILPTDIDERKVDVGGRTEHVRGPLSRLTAPTNLNGFPSLSVPCGLSSTGLPIGLQLIGKPFDETSVYQLGHALERATPYPF